MEQVWSRVCALDEVSESIPMEIDVEGVDILLIRSGSEVHAIPALCPHMDERLSNGLCEGFSITCLKHLWQWDVRTGEPIANAELPLKKIPLKLVQGDVYIDSRVPPAD